MRERVRKKDLGRSKTETDIRERQGIEREKKKRREEVRERQR